MLVLSRKNLTEFVNADHVYRKLMLEKTQQSIKENFDCYVFDGSNDIQQTLLLVEKRLLDLEGNPDQRLDMWLRTYDGRRLIQFDEIISLLKVIKKCHPLNENRRKLSNLIMNGESHLDLNKQYLAQLTNLFNELNSGDQVHYGMQHINIGLQLSPHLVTDILLKQSNPITEFIRTMPNRTINDNLHVLDHGLMDYAINEFLLARAKNNSQVLDLDVSIALLLLWLDDPSKTSIKGALFVKAKAHDIDLDALIKQLQIDPVYK